MPRALTPEQASQFTSTRQALLRAEISTGTPGQDADSGAAQSGQVSGNSYYDFWKDEGSQLLLINGEYRSSIVIDPPTGQIPFAGDISGIFRRVATGPVRTDGPEGLTLAERCLMDFGSHAGPAHAACHV